MLRFAKKICMKSQKCMTNMRLGLSWIPWKNVMLPWAWSGCFISRCRIGRKTILPCQSRTATVPFTWRSMPMGCRLKYRFGHMRCIRQPNMELLPTGNISREKPAEIWISGRTGQESWLKNSRIPMTWKNLSAIWKTMLGRMLESWHQRASRFSYQRVLHRLISLIGFIPKSETAWLGQRSTENLCR